MTVSDANRLCAEVRSGDAEALRRLERMAADGDMQALFWMGVLHDQEISPVVARDLAKARKYYERAVGFGHAHAAYQLAHMLQEGDGGPVNLPEARRLYGLAAEVGLRDAQLRYARCLEGAIGGPADTESAEHWYQAAIRQNDEMAATNLALMHLTGTAKQPDAKLAVKLLDFAAERLDGKAHYLLAQLLAEGRVIHVNPNRSLFHYAVAELLCSGAEQQAARERKDWALKMQPQVREPLERAARGFVEQQRRQMAQGSVSH